MGLQKDKKLNNLLERLPEGVAVPAHWLADHGYSRQLVYKYVQSNWLVSLGRGVYSRPQASVNWQGLLLGMQNFAGLTFHVGSVSALNVQGYAHYLPLGSDSTSGGNVIHLWGQGKVPAWVKVVALSEVLEFHTLKLFDESVSDIGFESVSSGVRDLPLRIASPERAILEVLYDVRDDVHSFSHAFELFEGLTSLKPKQMNELLQHCRSIKVKRLFLYMADQFSYPWIKRLQKDRLDLGSGKRVIVKGGKLDKQYLITVPERFNV